MRRRGTLSLAAVAGAGLAAAQLTPAASLAWAALAGVGLSAMLSGFTLRLITALVSLLSLCGAGWTGVAGHLWATLGFALTALAAGLLGWWTPHWHRRVAVGTSPRDAWQVMDEGGDPTADEMHG